MKEPMCLILCCRAALGRGWEKARAADGCAGDEDDIIGCNNHKHRQDKAIINR